MKRLALAMGLALCASTAYAQNRVVIFTNDSDTAVEQLFGSNVGIENWEEDLLGDDVLEPGDSIEVNFDDGTGYCKFDFKASFADGTDGVLADVNVCEVGSVSIG